MWTYSKVRRFLGAVKEQKSGNATLMVAIGIPALIGGSGLAVDMGQWYMWKRELQYAVDQAALAGAYAMIDEDSQAQYGARAQQEFTSNLAATSSIVADPRILLLNYNGGDQNSVFVSSTVTEELPFSSFLTGHATTVYASAQASFTEGRPFTSCILATDGDASGAVTIGGNATLVARCGIAALSTSDSSIVINGNPDVNPGWVISKGGIDDWYDQYTDAEIYEYMDGLSDPFATLSPPLNSTARSYSQNENCRSTVSYTASGIETTVIKTEIYQGNSPNSNSLQSTTYSDPVYTTINRAATSSETSGSTTTSSVATTTEDRGPGASPRYIRTVTTTTITRDISISSRTNSPQSSLLPGTYSDLKLMCNAVLQPGIYVIDGGDFETNSNYTVSGNGVMFVLKNGAGFKVNGGATINLTAMTAAQLLNASADSSISTSAANALEGMLVFEDRNSSGNGTNKLNGSAGTTLNGTIYLPVSGISFAGTVQVTSQCLMIAANTVSLLGTANMSTFCPEGLLQQNEVVTAAGTVKLVA